jgi:type I restriction enzyme, S subunit
MPWSIVKLGAICKTGAGGTPLKSKKEYYDGGNVPWIVSGEVAQGNITQSQKFITEEGLRNSSAKIFPPNTVLVAMYGATAGQVGILRFEASTNQAVCGIFPNKNTVPEYIYYAFLLKKDELISKATGNAQPNISQIKIKNTQIPFPPLPEQQRIVAILDEAFEGIGAAVANAEKNLANARELFESYLNNVFTQKGEGWVEKNLGELCERITKGSSPKWQGISYVENPGILFITSENVGNNNLIMKKLKFVEGKFNEKDKKSILQYGDVLTNIVGASIGRTAIFDRRDEANINQAVCLIRTQPEHLMNKYLSYLLNSPFFRQILHDNEIDNARANLSLGFFKNLLIPVPNVTEQETIVERISRLDAETQRLETIFQQKLYALAELKQSILQKAFSGELTRQDAAA